MSPRARVADVPPSLLTVAHRVEQRLQALLDHEQHRWEAVDPDLGEPLRALTQLVMSGGKRLRPAFCYWGYVGAGGDPEADIVIDTGAAFEMLQAFALAHDDVMDGSDVRRGAPTAHVEASRHHEQERWRGEARRFGEGVAILVGDLAHVYADVLFANAPAKAIDVWNELRIELNVGQYLDILGTVRGDTDRESARLIARYKSGKYTIERPLHVGAALAERFDEHAPALSGYGEPLGEAFQLRDDILGVFGDEAVTGKPVGDDLCEGKPTLLLAVATARAGRPGQELLARVGAENLSVDEIQALQQLLVDTGAVIEVEASIDALTAEALKALASASVTPAAAEALEQLAHYVAWREQ